MTFTAPIHINEQSIDRVVHVGLPVVLVFWRNKDCPPCEQLNSVLDRAARIYAGRTLFAKVEVSDNLSLLGRYAVAELPSLAKLNIDESPRTAQQYGIMSIPALYIFRGGQVVDRLVGAQPATVLRQALAKHC